MVHRPTDRLIVTTQADLDKALADGWVLSRRAFDAPAQDPAVSVDLDVGIADESPDDTPTVDIPLPVEPPKRKPGRPRKAVQE